MSSSRAHRSRRCESRLLQVLLRGVHQALRKGLRLLCIHVDNWQTRLGGFFTEFWIVDRSLDAGFELAFYVLRQRSEEHTSELQSLIRISYDVFCLKTKKHKPPTKL